MPETEIHNLDELLAVEKDAERRSVLLEVKSQLLVQCVPPRIDEAIAAANASLAEAPDPERKLSATLTLAQILDRSGETQTARARIDDIMTAYPEPSASSIKLFVEKGLLLEKEGDSTGAIAAFEDALCMLEKKPELLSPEVLESSRIAGFRLAQLYRSRGDQKKVDEVAERVKRLVALLSTP